MGERLGVGVRGCASEAGRTTIQREVPMARIKLQPG